MAWTRVTQDTVIQAGPGRVYKVHLAWGGGVASTAGKVWAIYNATTIGSGTALIDGAIETAHGTRTFEFGSRGNPDDGVVFDTGIVFAQNDANGVIRATIEYS